jgi:hypothetical protein
LSWAFTAWWMAFTNHSLPRLIQVIQHPHCGRGNKLWSCCQERQPPLIWHLLPTIQQQQRVLFC